jgi:AcrR family transcriptional regulator
LDIEAASVTLTPVEPADPRVRRTRHELTVTLETLLHEHTLDTISVRDIAASARINRSTFYAHFVDKYALFSHLIAVRFGEVVRQHSVEPGAFDAEHLRQLTLAVLTFMQQLNRAWCRVGAHGQMRPLIEAEVQRQLQGRIRDWLAQPGLGGPEGMERDLIVTFASWAIFGAGVALEQYGDEPLETVAGRVVVMLAVGIASLRG